MDVLSPAKINLFLHVIGKRPDGYHELQMLVCAVSLFDRVTLDVEAPRDEVTCNVPDIPCDASNLALRAARLFRHELNLPGFTRIHLEKTIPAGAGLGGGSSNAASVLTAMNAYYGYPLSDAELVRLGMSLGADVPFFIHGRPAFVGGLGEKIEFCEIIKPYTVVIVHPGLPLSTASVYKKLNFGLTKSEKKIKSPLLNKGLVDPVMYLFNDLEAPAFSLCSEIKPLKDALTMHGAEGVLMSGSGSSVFGLYSDPDNAGHACEALTSISARRGERNRWKVFLADMIV
ncbi:4-(cytidine 5'-diphospho)-2-C-methyl-D-erythritol kinase [Desulfatiferula olefinivorans]